MSYDILGRELIRVIMGNFGMIPKSSFGTQGIASEKFLTSKTLDIQYDNAKVVKYNVYAAQMIMDNDKIKTICTSLEDDLAVVFGFDGMPVLYGLRLDYFASAHDLVQDKAWHRDSRWGRFCLKLDETKWSNASLFDRLMVCAGVEKLASSEYFWSKCNDYEDLLVALTELVEM